MIKLSPEIPGPESFGLTTDQVAKFRSQLTPSGGTAAVVIGVIAGFFGVSIVPASWGLSGLWPFLLFAFFGMSVAHDVAARRQERVKRQVGYSQYLRFQSALINARRAASRVRRHERLMTRAKRDADWDRLRQLGGTGFELEVFKILASKRYPVCHTGMSGDEGVDLRIDDNGRVIIIQCKAFKSYVSAGPVRDLYGTLLHHRASEAWLVTTSGFYRGARAFATGKPIRLMTICDLRELPSADSPTQ